MIPSDHPGYRLPGWTAFYRSRSDLATDQPDPDGLPVAAYRVGEDLYLALPDHLARVSGATVVSSTRRNILRTRLLRDALPPAALQVLVTQPPAAMALADHLERRHTP